jgi:hypothetical protein
VERFSNGDQLSLRTLSQRGCRSQVSR